MEFTVWEKNLYPKNQMNWWILRSGQNEVWSQWMDIWLSLCDASCWSPGLFQIGFTPFLCIFSFIHLLIHLFRFSVFIMIMHVLVTPFCNFSFICDISNFKIIFIEDKFLSVLIWALNHALWKLCEVQIG